MGPTQLKLKAVMRSVQPQTVSVKVGLRHREMAQMLLLNDLQHKKMNGGMKNVND